MGRTPNVKSSMRARCVVPVTVTLVSTSTVTWDTPRDLDTGRRGMTDSVSVWGFGTRVPRPVPRNETWTGRKEGRKDRLRSKKGCSVCRPPPCKVKVTSNESECSGTNLELLVTHPT